MGIAENFRNGRDADVVKTYVKQYLHEDKDNLYYKDNTADV